MNISEIDRDFGERVREARTGNGMKQDQLAEAVEALDIGMTPATIGKIERGERRVTIGEATAIARALDMEVIDLTRGKGSLRASLMLLRLDIEKGELAAAFARLGRAIESLAVELSELDPEIELPEDQLDRLREAVHETPIELAMFHSEDVLTRIRRNEQINPEIKDMIDESWSRRLRTIDTALQAQQEAQDRG